MVDMSSSVTFFFCTSAVPKPLSINILAMAKKIAIIPSTPKSDGAKRRASTIPNAKDIALFAKPFTALHLTPCSVSFFKFDIELIIFLSPFGFSQILGILLDGIHLKSVFSSYLLPVDLGKYRFNMKMNGNVSMRDNGAQNTIQQIL